MNGDDYSGYLQGFKWDAMLTVTFRKPRKDPIYNRQQIWNSEISSFAKRAFLISEPHTTGFLHYHGLVKFVSGAGGPKHMCNWLETNLTNRFGWSAVSPIRNMQEVAGYCSKYVVKSIEDSAIDYDFMGDWSK